MAYTTIDDPSAYFHTQLYTGNGSTNAITNDANAGDFQPDWLWIKTRSHSSSHRLMDSSRLASGEATLSLRSEDSAAESDIANDGMTSLDSDGFTLNGNGSGGPVNENSKTYVAWQWKANGGTTASNSNGSITSTVQANTTAGFSIVTYTGTGSTATVGHGLGAKPDVYIVKTRSEAQEWMGYFNGTASDPETDGLRLDTTDAITDAATFWNDTAPTSSVFTVNTSVNVNKSSATYVAYCFTPIQGYSKFGSYNGNGNADGPFIYTGFKPAWVMTKRTDTTGNWYIYDSTRNGSSGPDSNQVHKILYANDISAELDNNTRGMDMNANGFKIRNTLNDTNNSSGTYIYMAFAHHPFVSSEGVPVTAR